MQDAKYKVLIGEIRSLREEVGRIDRDMSRDRQDMEDFKVQMSGMKEEMKQIRVEFSAHADKVKDKVEDALEPARFEVKQLGKEIKQKRMIVIKDKFDLIGWLKFTLGLGEGGDKK